MSKDIEKKDGVRELACKLTDQEKIIAGETLVEYLKEIDQKEQELKRIQGRYKVEISDLQVKADYQSEMIETGVEMRKVPIRTTKNFTTGIITVTRLDIHEDFETRAMTPEESQKEIPLGDPVKPKEDKPVEKKAKAVKKAEADEQAPETAQDAPQPTPKKDPKPVSDEEVEAATGHIRESKRASVSTIQRRMRVSYQRACEIMDELEKRMIVGPATEDGGVRDFFDPEKVKPVEKKDGVPDPF